MPIVANRPKTLSNVLKREQWAEDGFCRKDVVANESAETEYVVGTILGQVTADEKYKKAVAGAGDGSETPAAMFMGAGPSFAPTLTVPANTDTPIIALVRGPAIIGDNALDLGTGITIDDVKAAFEAKSISVDSQVKNQLNN